MNATTHPNPGNPMPLSERLKGWRDAAPTFRTRQAKHLRQLARGFVRPQQISFVFGCQRSGTKMLMRILEESPQTHIWHENNALAFQDFELRSDPVLRALAASSPAPCQIFKPICDSQRADELLADFPRARGFWIYRHPGDVARSAVRKWGEHQREVIDAIAAGELERWGWRTRDLPAEAIEAIRAVHRPDLSAHEGALLFWWLRNQFYFARGLDRHPRMLLVRYERLADDPDAGFRRVFAHAGATYDPLFARRVHTGSLRESWDPEPDPAIRQLCEALLERLDQRAAQPQEPALVSPVLMLIDTLYIGGAERYVVMVSNWMARAGIDVIVGAKAAQIEGELDPEVHFVDLPLMWVRKRLPVAAAMVSKLIHTERPAAIVCHSLATTLVARAAAAGTGIPVVNVAHGWPADRYSRVAPLMRAADRVIAVSPDVRDKLVGGGLPAERCSVVQNGIDFSPFEPRAPEQRAAMRASLGVEPDQLLVLNVGRLSAQKAHHHVFAIAKRLRDSHPRLRFAIAGTGERADELASLLDASGQADRVTLLGERRDIPELLDAADIFLSCSDWEGMPLTTIEAMVSRLPCVATRTEGTALLLGEESGTVVDVGDVEALSAALARLADDDQLRQQMGRAARERARERFSHDRVAREIMQILDELVHPAL
jgi:glycosyltransferase involved in cell wall biosynthesis